MSRSSLLLPNRVRRGRMKRWRGFMGKGIYTRQRRSWGFGDEESPFTLFPPVKSSGSDSGGLHHERDDRGHAVPALRGELELLAAGPGQGIIFGAAVVLGHAPLGLDPALFLHAVERGIERTLV